MADDIDKLSRSCKEISFRLLGEFTLHRPKPRGTTRVWRRVTLHHPKVWREVRSTTKHDSRIMIICVEVVLI